MKGTTLCLLLLLSTVSALGQGTYPLAKGNLWQFWDHDYQNGQWFWIYGWTEKVLGDTLMPNGETYAVISSDWRGSGAVEQYFMRQEGSNVILGYNQISPDSDYVLYDFSKTVGDTMRLVVYPSGGDTELSIIAADDHNYFFGSLWCRYQDYLTVSLTSSYYWIDRVADGIGLVYQEGEAGTTWYLRGAIIDNVSYGTIVSVDNERPTVLASFQLEQNFPNPFNPSTTIEYALPRAAFVTLKVYNVLGEEVATLIDGEHEAGTFSTNWDASHMPSGVYFCRLRAGDYVTTRSMLLMR